MTPRNNSPSTIPPTQVENETSTTPASEMNPQAAEFCPLHKNHAPTRVLTWKLRFWCPIHSTSKHTLEDCQVILHVKAELYACRDQGFSALHQEISPIALSTKQDPMISLVARSSSRRSCRHVSRSNSHEFNLSVLQKDRMQRRLQIGSWVLSTSTLRNHLFCISWKNNIPLHRVRRMTST